MRGGGERESFVLHAWIAEDAIHRIENKRGKRDLIDVVLIRIIFNGL